MGISELNMRHHATTGKAAIGVVPSQKGVLTDIRQPV
jgi:hypothetical protein